MRRDFDGQGDPGATVCGVRGCSMGRREVGGVLLCNVCDGDALALALAHHNQPKEG